MKTKRLTAAIAALLLLVSCLLTSGLAVHAEDALPSGEEMPLQDGRATDHLTDEKDVNVHTFEMTEKGDAVVTVLPKDGGTTLWRWSVTLLASDRKTVLGEAKVRDTLEVTMLCATELERGTYYICVSAGASFSANSYELSVTKGLASSLPKTDAKTVRVMDKAGLICTVSGHSFVKLYDGEAYAALYRVGDGGIVLPMLISKEERAVEYVLVSTGDHVKASSSTIRWNGEDYYYSYGDWVDPYAGTGYQSYRERALYLANDKSDAASDAAAVLKRHEKNEKGIVLYLLSHYWGWLVAALVIAALIIVKVKIFGTSSADDDDTSGYGGGGSGSSAPPPDDDTDAYGRPYPPSGPPDVRGI